MNTTFADHPAIAPARAGSRKFFLAVGAYVLLQVALRLALPASLELDEAEQVFAYQYPGLGYGAQPPLYAWLQWLAFGVFGVNLFALAALKNLLLFATCACMFFAARGLAGTGAAIAASVSLVMLPSIGWEAQRDLTHSVLATCIASATLWCYFALLRRPAGVRYALLGALLGLGMLSKYNFAVFAAGLAGASLLLAPHRTQLWNRKIIITAAVAALLLLPHGWWLLDNTAAAFGATAAKMRLAAPGAIGEHAGYAAGAGAALLNLGTAALAFLTPLWLVYAWICRNRLRSAKVAWNNPAARFFVLLYACFFVLLALLVLSGEMRHVRSRWMLPLLFSAPLAFFVLFPSLSEGGVQRRIVRAAAVFALLILVALPARVVFSDALGKQVRSNIPYPQLSAAIAQQFPHVDTVLADTMLLAGNLHFQRQALRTRLVGEVLAHPAPLPGQVLLVTSGGAAGPLARLKAAWPGVRVLRQGTFLPARASGHAAVPFEFAHLLLEPARASPARNEKSRSHTYTLRATITTGIDKNKTKNESVWVHQQ